MRRGPQAARAHPEPETILGIQVNSDRSDWMTAEEAAAYLRKFRRKDGKPSVGAIHSMVYRGQLIGRKFFGRLLFRRTELDRLIALSPTTGG